LLLWILWGFKTCSNHPNSKTLAPMGASYDYSAYLNYVDDRLDNYQQLYYGNNLARLRQLKAKLDPTNVFTAPSTVHV